MMKIHIHILLTILFTGLYMTGLSAQDERSDIIKCFRSGDPSLLEKHLESSITLIILNNEYDADKGLVTEKLREFFRNNPPLDFNIKFSSDKENSKFIIGSLRTEQTSYRINLFFKKENNNNRIHLLRIEEEN